MLKQLTLALATGATLLLAGCSKSNDIQTTPSGSTGATGTGGSLARFTIAQGHLYAVDGQTLYAYSLANAANPQLSGTTNLGWEIETLYAYEDKLFIGSQSAMYIYSIANPEQPQYVAQASHVRACDPVVANGTTAYVTVRSTGTNCGGSADELLVYDISTITSPQLLATRAMQSPWGLGLHGDKLYVCDGSAGMVVFDVANPANPQPLQQLNGEAFYDVIPLDNVLIAMIQGGMALYTYGPDGTLTAAGRMMD